MRDSFIKSKNTKVIAEKTKAVLSFYLVICEEKYYFKIKRQ